MKINTPTKFVYLLIFSTIFLACAKENIIQQPENDQIIGRKIRYIVHVVASKNVNFKNTMSLDSATVCVVVDGKTQTQKVDSQHIAIFDNLYSGSAIVKIQCKGFTSVGYIVDLRQTNDSNATYDSQNCRIVSTIVYILPLTGSGTTTIKGNTYAQLDLTSSNYENAPENINIIANIISDDLKTLIEHSQDCRITNLYYSGLNASAKTNSNGSFQLIVPTTHKGLKYEIRTDDFIANQLVAPNIFETKIFKSLTDTIKVFSDITKIKDIYFQTE